MSIRHRIPVILAAVALCSGCGGGAQQKQLTPEEASGFGPKTQSGGGGSSRPSRTARKDARKSAGFKANPSWDRIAPHFLAFASQMDAEIHNPAMTWKYRDAFQSNIEKFFPETKEERSVGKVMNQQRPGRPGDGVVKKESGVRSILDALKKAGTQPVGLTEAGGMDEGTKDPLLVHPLSSYRVQIIMTGTSNPEAQILLPGGEVIVVHVNDRLGVEGGHVQDILKQEVLVKIPEKDAPQIVSLMPPLLPSEFANP
ncbi:MAG: hypothetical protein FJ098_06285 [Deltaproteobacteria bacterium]|nr:hypothetical protein [Deltaproteobacteria bacterium]